MNEPDFIDRKWYAPVFIGIPGLNIDIIII